MSWRASAWAKTTRGHKSTGQKLVLLILADYASPNTNEAWPTIKLLADDAEIAERSVQRHLASLQQQGYVTITPRSDEGKSSIYTLSLPPDYLAPGDVSVTPPHDAEVIPPPDTSVAGPPTPVSPALGELEPSLEPSSPSLRSGEENSPVLEESPAWLVEARQTQGWAEHVVGDTALVGWASDRGIGDEQLMSAALALSSKAKWGPSNPKKFVYSNLAQTFKAWAQRPPLEGRPNGKSQGHAPAGRASSESWRTLFPPNQRAD